MRRSERAKLDEVLRLEKSARRPKRGNNEQRVADIGVTQAMEGVWSLKGNDRTRVRRGGNIAGDAERRRGLKHHVAHRHGPGQAFRGKAGQPRPLKPEAYDLPIARA